MMKKNNLKTQLPSYIKEGTANMAKKVTVTIEAYKLNKKNPNLSYNTEYCRKLYSEALSRASQELQLKPTTIRDALERRSKRNATATIQLLQRFLANNDLNALRDLLMPNNGTNYSIYDKKVFIESIKVILCMEYGVPIECDMQDIEEQNSK